MDNHRILSALCYFSVLFAPFLLPIIVYFISSDTEIKHHAKRSLISHMIPIGVGLIGIIFLIVGSFTLYSPSPSLNSSTSFDFYAASLPFLFMVLYFILSIIVLIWNIVQGVKLLR